jgi:hypothetical protein
MDIAAAVCFLASPLTDFMTGTTFRIDGGSTPTVWSAETKGKRLQSDRPLRDVCPRHGKGRDGRGDARKFRPLIAGIGEDALDEGELPARLASTAAAPSRSCTLAGCTTTLSKRPTAGCGFPALPIRRERER